MKVWGKTKLHEVKNKVYKHEFVDDVCLSNNMEPKPKSCMIFKATFFFSSELILGSSETFSSLNSELVKKLFKILHQ